MEKIPEREQGQSIDDYLSQRRSQIESHPDWDKKRHGIESRGGAGLERALGINEPVHNPPSPPDSELPDWLLEKKRQYEQEHGTAPLQPESTAQEMPAAEQAQPQNDPVNTTL